MTLARYQPRQRELTASFPLELAGAVRCDRFGDVRRTLELELTHRALLLERRGFAGAAGLGRGGFAQRRQAILAAFDATKLAGCVVAVNASRAGSYATSAASLSDGSAFDAASWTKTNVTVSPDDTTAPDGTTSADKCTVSSTAAPKLEQAATNASSGAAKAPATLAVYVKRGTGGSGWFYLTAKIGSELAADRVWFNVGAGAVGTVGSSVTGAAIASVGSGWYKLQFSTKNVGANPAGLRIYPVTADNVTTGDAVSSNFWLWGASIDEVRFTSLVNAATSLAWTQATVDAQPGVNVAGINGRQTLALSGAQFIQSSADSVAIAAFADAAPSTVFLVAKLGNLDIKSVIFCANKVDASFGYKAFLQNNAGAGNYGTEFRGDSPAAASATASAGSTTTTGGQVLEWSDPGTSISLWKDGSLLINAVAHASATTSVAKLTIGGFHGTTLGNAFVGDVGNCVAFSRVLGAVERSYIRVGLGNRWAVAVTP
jgi:hypothetical protein